jgi:hypothetical protein
MKELVNHPLFQISSYIIGILGVLLSVYFYRKGKSQKVLSHFMNNFVVIGGQVNEFNKLSVFYDKVPVSNLTITEFYLWNSGNTIINGSDIAAMSNISIKCEGEGQVLEQEILICSDHSNNCKSKLSDNTIHLSFDYLRPNEGCKIKVTHTADNLRLEGKLKESEIRYQIAFKDRSKFKDDMKGAIIITLFTIIYSIISFKYPDHSTHYSSYGWILMLPLCVWVYAKCIKSYKLNRPNSIFK